MLMEAHWIEIDFHKRGSDRSINIDFKAKSPKNFGPIETRLSYMYKNKPKEPVAFKNGFADVKEWTNEEHVKEIKNAYTIKSKELLSTIKKLPLHMFHDLTFSNLNNNDHLIIRIMKTVFKKLISTKWPIIILSYDCTLPNLPADLDTLFAKFKSKLILIHYGPEWITQSCLYQQEDESNFDYNLKEEEDAYVNFVESNRFYLDCNREEEEDAYENFIESNGPACAEEMKKLGYFK